MQKMIGFAACLFVVACTIDDDVSVDDTQQESVSSNGVSLNGVSLNGVSLNGVSLNGVSLNGVSLNGTTVTGVKTSTGATYTSSSIGTVLTASLSNSTTLKLRIDTAATLAAPNADLWSYGVSYQADGTWKPLCGTGVKALQVMGTWGSTGAHSASSTNFTFACRAASIAKCVEMGYKPAKGYTNQMLTCVRLLRGDYCGTGVPYTVTGNQVNIYDALGIQRDTQSTWKKEAEWTPNGARCISLDKFTRFTQSGTAVPTCVSSGAMPTASGCGQSFTSGAVIISELP